MLRLRRRRQLYEGVFLFVRTMLRRESAFHEHGERESGGQSKRLRQLRRRKRTVRCVKCNWQMGNSTNGNGARQASCDAKRVGWRGGIANTWRRIDGKFLAPDSGNRWRADFHGDKEVA